MRYIRFYLFIAFGATSNCLDQAAREEVHQMEAMQLHIDDSQVSTLQRLQRKSNSNGTDDITLYEALKKNQDVVEITSENYPNPYPVGNETWNLKTKNATGFELVIGVLDIASNTDFLKIYLDEVDLMLKVPGIILTGRLKAPLKMRYLRTDHLRIEFSSNSVNGHDHKGFSLTYTPFGEKQELTTSPPTEVAIDPDNLSTHSIILAVEERLQNNQTWYLFRQLLCDAANKYVAKHNLSLEVCHPQHVAFAAVSECSSLWPNNANCVEVTFRILLLKENEVGFLTTENPLGGSEFNFPEEMTVEHLKAMWGEFGRSIFKLYSFPSYNPPGTNGLVLFWGGMTIAVLIVFVMFLTLLSRLTLMKTFVSWSMQNEDKQNILTQSQDIDITMFPSPHQVVPTLFPTSTNPYSPGSSFLYGGDVYDNRSRDALECFNETNPRLLPALRRGSSFEVDERIVTFHANGNEKLSSFL